MREPAGWREALPPSEFTGPRPLRQRVAHAVVALREKLLLFICAGQRVAAVVGAHVERGVHRVGEVGGLQRPARDD